MRLLEYSEDDAWIAATFIDGSVRIWDAATARPIGDPIRMPPQSREHEYGQVDLLVPDDVNGMVFVGDWPDAIGWPVPFDARVDEPLLRRPLQARRVPPTATAFRPALGLLAAGAQNGEIRIWRSRPNFADRYRGAPQFPVHDEPAYDGTHLLRVAGSELQVIDGRTQQPASKPFVLDQPAGFAELVGGTPWLVATSGNTLHRYDWRAGRELDPVIELDATPGEMMVNGSAVLVRMNAFENGANLERLEAWSLESGRRVGRAEFPGRIGSLQYDADGRIVAVTGEQRVRLFDAATLAEIASIAPGDVSGSYDWQHHGYGNVVAIPGRSARTLWVAGDFGKPVVSLDVASRTVTGSWSVGGDVRAMLPLGSGDRLALIAFGYTFAPILGGNGPASVPAPDANSVGAFAESGDATRFALARARGFIVFDSASGEWLTPPIDFALERNDLLVGLALGEHGTEVRARTSNRRWLRQSLPSEERPVEDLLALVDVLSPSPATMDRAFAPDIGASLRASLRAADPGPPPALQAPDPDVAPVGRPFAPGLVELGPSCNRRADAPGEVRSYEIDRVPAEKRTFEIDHVLPPGRQRLLGVDYRIDCGVLAPVTGIRVATPAVSALNVLMSANRDLRAAGPAPYAYLDLHYHDKSSARLTINYGEHAVVAFNSPDVTTARRAYTAAGTIGSPQLFAVHFDDPHPERELVSVDWLASDRLGSEPMLLGLTLEPEPAVARAHRRR